MTFNLQITGWDGGTISLAPGATICTQSGWSPRVARRKVSRLGGPVYEDVTESIPIFISPSSGSVLTSLNNLVAALDQAERWQRGENVTAVVLEYTPTQTTLSNPLKAVITGARDVSGFAEMVALANGFQSTSVNNQVVATLQITRRGLWLEDSTETITDAAATTLVVNSATFTDTGNYLSLPIDVTVSSDQAGSPSEWFIVITNDADKIQIQDIGATADAGHQPYGGGILQLSPGASWTDSGTAHTWSLVTGTRNTGMFINVRPDNNNFLIRGWVRDLSTGTKFYTQAVPVPDSDNDIAKWKFLGVVTLPLDGAQFGFEAIAPGGSGTLDIDAMVIVSMDGDDWHVHYTDATAIQLGDEFIFNHRYLTHKRPFFYTELTVGGNDLLANYQGTPFISLTGDEIATIFLGTGQGATTNDDYWQQSSTMQTALSATRRRGYLVPV